MKVYFWKNPEISLAADRLLVLIRHALCKEKADFFFKFEKFDRFYRLVRETY